MVLLVELLLAAGVLFGVYRLATRTQDGMAEVEPDRAPAEREDGPLTADELVAMHIPLGVGYRKVDVDRLLDRIARQLPRAVHEPAGVGGRELSAHEPLQRSRPDGESPAPGAGHEPAHTPPDGAQGTELDEQSGTTTDPDLLKEPHDG